jgi:cob(I)alamin adenosyltransferase
MPKLTRIYTRTGDDGTTGLVGGQRVKKSAPRIESYGTVDETSSVIGLARAHLHVMLRSSAIDQERMERVGRRLDAWLAWVQDVLFNVGSDLATLPENRRPGMPLVTQADIDALERAIDEAQTELTPLANFIHPGGDTAGATLQLARTVARRAERLVVALAETEDIHPLVVLYLNRLSDALFVWARWINWAVNAPEALWVAETQPPKAV